MDIKEKQNNMNVFTDPRDGEVYKTVEINDQIWMAENLRYKGPTRKVNNWTIEEKNFYYPPNGEAKNIKNYGCLYTWDNALNACPDGWHLPSKEEFDTLLIYVSVCRKSSSNFLALMAKSPAWTKYSDQGGDDFGFGTLPAGHYNAGDYYEFGRGTYFWSATEVRPHIAYYWYLGTGHTEINIGSRTYAFSIRCIKD